MIRTLILAGVSALGLSAAAFADVKVQEIDVDADLTAINNPEAAAVFANLPADLEAAISARLAPDHLVTEGGSKINIDIDEVELASTWANLADLSQSKLKGVVNVTSDTNNTKFDNYTLTIAYPDAVAFVPKGADAGELTKDAPVYYQALINAFADYVVTHLK
ncbi:hypothetical protein [Paenirhodobacter sp.]|uniref:hypothetical protein n=1 Tax=Paenirhodobacter sp. TaxID=1965326 RepID=UPI003B3F1788